MKPSLLLPWFLLAVHLQAADPATPSTNLPAVATNLGSAVQNPPGAKTNLFIELFKNASAVAVIAGGLWGIYHYVRGRTYEKKLLIDIKTRSNALNEKRVLFIEAELTNAGKGILKARRVGPDDYVYKDESEELKHSCNLQIKRVVPKKIEGEVSLDWYKCAALELVSDIPAEINLLDDYAVPAESNEVVFWLEPGEIAYLPAVVVLNPGHYLLKVSFYGTVPLKDYWSRLAYVRLE